MNDIEFPAAVDDDDLTVAYFQGYEDGFTRHGYGQNQLMGDTRKVRAMLDAALKKARGES